MRWRRSAPAQSEGGILPPADALRALLAAERAGSLPPLLPFWGHDPEPGAGPIGRWVLSQWWDEHPFVQDGVTFRSAEYAMMHGKAVAMGDHSAAEEILAAFSAREAQAIGRRVQNFDQATWDRVKYDIVMRANRAKFNQHSELRDYLVSTAPAVLVEANPYDEVWAVGFEPDDPEVQTPSRWRGENLLGFAITQVRLEMIGR